MHMRVSLPVCIQEFDGSMGSGATAATPPLVSDNPKSMQGEASMPQYVQQGLDQLGLGPDERAVNVCLLGVLPGFRRRGVARQILVQVVNAARSAG